MDIENKFSITLGDAIKALVKTFDELASVLSGTFRLFELNPKQMKRARLLLKLGFKKTAQRYILNHIKGE